MEEFIANVLALLSLPEYGLSTLFVVSFFAATVLPLAPTPVLAGLIRLNPELFWPAIFVASIGNTLGGAVTWWMGYGAKNLHEKITNQKTYGRVMSWLDKVGPKACLLAWFPVFGDAICIASGWLKMPFLPCVSYMFIGRFSRFLFVASVVLLIWPNAYTL